jgi:Flp pilus assembly protein TadD
MPARHPKSNRIRLRRFSGRAATILVLAAALAGLGGCASRGAKDTTGSIDRTAPLARSADDWKAIAATWGPRYDKDPGEKQASMNYARALRGLHQEQQAVAVMQNAAIRAPNDRAVLALYGRTLADAGRFPEAAKVLANAHTPDQPDWRIYNVQGTVAAQTGDFAGAQRFFDSALQIVPGEPTVLSNMGLAYALQRRLGDAEKVLRQAANDTRADARIRANLAIVLALQGKFTESEQIAQRDLPPADAAANIAYVRNMVSQTNSWKQIQALDKAAAKRRG